MAKSFKNLISEVAQPKAGEEKAFKDQHSVQKFDAQPTGQDHIFKGTIDTKKRLADIMRGEDEAKYDAAYSKKRQTFELPREIDEAADEPASPDEASMAKKQCEFIQYVGREVCEHVEGGKEFPEWMQNKLSAVHQAAKDLHATLGAHGPKNEAAEVKAGDECKCCGGTIDEAGKCGCGPDCEHCGGQHELGEETQSPVDSLIEKLEELEEAQHHDWHVTFKTGHKPQRVKGRNTAEAIRKAEKRAQKSGEKDPRQLAMYKSIKKVSEETELDEAKKGKPLTMKQMRRALATAKAAPKDKVTLKKAPFDIPKEEVDLEEKFTIKTSILKLDSGEKVKVSRQDADLLNKFFRELNPRNSNEMRKVLVKDKAGYEEILGFAREAL